jgi:hypothetical protein
VGADREEPEPVVGGGPHLLDVLVPLPFHRGTPENDRAHVESDFEHVSPVRMSTIMIYIDDATRVK